MNLLTPGIHHDVPDEAYRKEPGFNQSLLKSFAKANTPAHFKWGHDHPTEPSESLRIGSFSDILITRPDSDPMSRFIVWPDTRRGNAWKAFQEANKGKIILTQDEHDRGLAIAEAVRAHDDAMKLIRACRSQVVVIAENPRLGAGFRMKALIDLLPDTGRCDPALSDYVFDLKTTKDASPEGFTESCWKFGYDVQAAFYLDALEYAGGPKANHFGFIAVENEPPYGVKIHFFRRDSKELRRARESYEAWMKYYAECLAKNNWPGYTDSWTELSFKPWQIRTVDWQGEAIE